MVRMPIYLAFFIGSTPRTGSSLLSEALEFTRIAGTPREYFEPEYEADWFDRLGIQDDSQYIEKFLAAGSTPNGVFGAKVIWHQLTHLTARLRLILGNGYSDTELLDRTFPNLRYIFLTRRDKLRQAISYYKATQTDLWHAIQPLPIEKRLAPPPPFDPDRIEHWVTRFTEDEASWRRYFDRLAIEPFEVVYEDFLEAYEPTVRAILDHLKIPIPPGLEIQPPRLQKLADDVSEAWVHRYRMLKNRTSPVLGTVFRPYFICSTPRTGSGLLSEAIESTRLAGLPKEYFDPNFENHWLENLRITAESEYLEKIFSAGTTPNGVFGAKLHWHQFQHLRKKLRLILGEDRSDLDRLHRAFPGLRYVFLTRRDKVRQAVSYSRAIQTGVWWLIRPDPNAQSPSQPAPAPTPRFDFAQIDHWVKHLTLFESEWRRYFQSLGVQPFEVVYEDFVEDYDSTVLAILRYLDLPNSDGLKIAPPRLMKQADSISEEWVHRYRQLKGL